MGRRMQQLALFSDERGATSIEYALIASLLSVVILSAVASIGSSLNSIFSSVSSGI